VWYIRNRRNDSSRDGCALSRDSAFLFGDSSFGSSRQKRDKRNYAGSPDGVCNEAFQDVGIDAFVKPNASSAATTSLGTVSGSLNCIAFANVGDTQQQ
jgi:hypothetical protein